MADQDHTPPAPPPKADAPVALPDEALDAVSGGTTAAADGNIVFVSGSGMVNRTSTYMNDLLRPRGG
ncbi:hypothetical protein GCM10007301_07820 [Azorhizobium oxalatiphilum]|uniref:Uncharacterized protein n=1 Tax=Azorhizobium oxalatiphilum TaxID=980631 RepID=A0A917BNH5_9HYPH|nr:hypothetical protein [Azorhizobium oxalatiphilum]GGF50855.1 hypothetical protein GCM10007301_07820 [Azorhizobium oxalatiphilum]